MKRFHFIHMVLTLILASFMIVLYYVQPSFISIMEDKTYDMRFHMRGPLPLNKQIAIVAIDDHSIEQIGRFPWSRDRFARLVDILSEGGAKAILFDVFFAESSDEKADSDLAQSIRMAGNITLPIFYEFSDDGRLHDITHNIPELEAAARHLSHINMSPDLDGVVRWTPLTIRDYPSLGLTGAMEALDADEYYAGDYEVTFNGRAVPVDWGHRMLINYSGPDGSYDRYSISEILSGNISPDEFRDRIVLIGATAVGIYDLRVTPYSNNTPGVEVNANIIDNIIRGDFLKRGWLETVVDLLAILFLTILVSVVILHVRPLIAFPFVISVVAGYSFLALKAFEAGMWINITLPVMGIVLSYFMTASVRFFILERSARQIRWMFSSYVSDKVVKELIRNPGLARVGGESKVITVMFCDIKGYTKFSERYSPREVVRTLNEYLGEMVDVIMKYDGTLDKFMGDGIMAFWGAPMSQEDHSELAVKCAFEMLERLNRLHEKWQTEQREALQAGIGINTGEVIVGNIGVEGKKMDYTAIGDVVNITYRIQNLSREYQLPVVTESLYIRVRHMVEAESLGSIEVKGREAPVNLYVLKGLKG